MSKMHVVIMIGQSNMVGYKTRLQDISEAWRKPISGAFVWQDEMWKPLTPGGGYQKKGFGPELAFAQKFCHTQGEKLGIIKVAQTATYLATHWHPDRENGLFTQLVNTVRAALMSQEVVLRGIIWMQGEADSITPEDAAAYRKNLENFVAKLRLALGSPLLPFIAGVVNPPADQCPYAKPVQEALRNNKIANYASVETNGLPKISDNLHYNMRGYNVLGKRFADALIDFDKNAFGTQQNVKWLWNSEQYQCWVSGPGFKTDIAIVSMPFAVAKDGFDEIGFGQIPFEKAGRCGVYIRSRISTWLQDDEIMEVAQAIRNHFGPDQRIVTYGASMGGYGALLLSKQLNAEKVLAIAPQYSINRAIVPWETRWKKAYKRIKRFVHNIDDEISPTAQKVILYDRMSGDRRQIDLFKTDETWQIVNLPYGSHQILRFLQETESLSLILSDIEGDGPDLDHLKHVARQNRRQSAIYWMTLMYQAGQQRPDLANYAARQAVALGGPERKLKAFYENV